MKTIKLLIYYLLVVLGLLLLSENAPRKCPGYNATNPAFLKQHDFLTFSNTFLIAKCFQALRWKAI